MGKQRWLPKSVLKAEAIDSHNIHLLLNVKKFKREREKAKKVQYNLERRAKQLCEKLKDEEDAHNVGWRKGLRKGPAQLWSDMRKILGN